MIYDISTPTVPVFVDYITNRNFSVTPSQANLATVGDLGPEDIKILTDSISPNGKTMMVVSNEVSGTVTLYSVEDPTGIADKAEALSFSVKAFPNPATDQVTVLLDKVNGIASVTLYDLQGKALISQVVSNNSQTVVNTSQLSEGMYLLRVRANGQNFVQKIIVR